MSYLSRLIVALCVLGSFSGGFCECLPEYRFDGQQVVLTEKEWKSRLSPEAFRVMRKGATELAYRNAYYNNEQPGIYVCAGCALPVYSSAAKFDSHTGWPSFSRPICERNVYYEEHAPFIFSPRVEVKCSRCSGHLGHLFEDGPPPTGKRYCMNSAALKFVPKL